MSALARWCARRRVVVLGAWLALLVALGAGAARAGSAFTDATTLPASESATAYRLLDQLNPGASDATSGSIVWKTTGVAVDDASVQAEVGAALAEIAKAPDVTSVVSPYTAAGAGQLNTAQDTAYARVTLSSTDHVDEVEEIAETLQSAHLDVREGGTAFTPLPAAGGIGEVLGILAALAILLLVFRSVWAAVLPIVTGVAGVIASLLTLTLVSHVVDLSSSTPTMGALVGLGVGIDYALFIVNRHRKALLGGASTTEALVTALTTSGRAVLFAGATVVIALVGVFVVQIDILTGMARGAALTVLLTVAAAVTLLPALLAVLGERVLSRRQRRELAALRAGGAAAAAGHRAGERGVAARWSRLVQRAPVPLAAVGAAVMVALALPALHLRLGSSDASSDPKGSATHSSFEMMSMGFGEGVDGSLVLVARTPDAASTAAFADLVTKVAGVHDVSAAQLSPSAPGQEISVATVVPASSAQTVATADLVATLRDDVVPAAERGTDLRVYVGGATATSIDTAQATLSKLPLYLALIAALGFLLLVVAFRSVLVPLIGALGNLVTLAVGLGVITAVFQWGWGTELLGVGGAAPIESLAPVLIIGVMFGLSMDYQVFLVSRMHEEWGRTRDNRRSVRVGLAETGGVIATAAAIMLCVFASFGFAGQRIVAEIGVGLAMAVLADAFVLRLMIVPAVMHLVGRLNWAYPRWAEAITPHLSVEGDAGARAAVPVSRAATAGETTAGEETGRVAHEVPAR